MNASDLGTLESVDARSIWRDEARDFTPWLAENLDALGNAIGLDLEFEQTEVRVGRFSLDIQAKDNSRDLRVVIENQLELSDHNHLGQLLTYAAWLEAGVIIWVATEFDAEHRRALNWLNQHTPASIEFYGVTIDLKKIDTSRLAPHFRPVVVPDTWPSTTRPTAGNRWRAGYGRFFEDLLEELSSQIGPEMPRVKPKGMHFDLLTEFKDIWFNTGFNPNGQARVRLSINRTMEFNRELFDALKAREHEIATRLDPKLHWDRVTRRRESMISIYTPATINDPDPKLVEVKDWIIKDLILFSKVFTEHLDELVPQVEASNDQRD